MHDRIEAMLNSLNKITKCKKASDDENNNINPFVIECSNIKTGEIVHKTIPRKSLNSWMSKEEENKIFLFFGRSVRLEAKETQHGNCYTLNIKTKKSSDWVYKINVFRGKVKDSIDENKIYNIAIIGHLEFYNSSPQIKTQTVSSMLYREASQ